MPGSGKSTWEGGTNQISDLRTIWIRIVRNSAFDFCESFHGPAGMYPPPTLKHAKTCRNTIHVYPAALSGDFHSLSGRQTVTACVILQPLGEETEAAAPESCSRKSQRPRVCSAFASSSQCYTRRTSARSRYREDDRDANHLVLRRPD